MKAPSCWHITTPRSSDALAQPRPSEALGNRHPGLDPGTRRKHPQTDNVAAYNWFPDQVRDDGYARASLGRGYGRNQGKILKRSKTRTSNEKLCMTPLAFRSQSFWMVLR